jgi:hypothetical protein
MGPKEAHGVSLIKEPPQPHRSYSKELAALSSRVSASTSAMRASHIGMSCRKFSVVDFSESKFRCRLARFRVESRIIQVCGTVSLGLLDVRHSPFREAVIRSLKRKRIRKLYNGQLCKWKTKTLKHT